MQHASTLHYLVYLFLETVARGVPHNVVHHSQGEGLAGGDRPGGVGERQSRLLPDSFRQEVRPVLTAGELHRLCSDFIASSIPRIFEMAEGGAPSLVSGTDYQREY